MPIISNTGYEIPVSFATRRDDIQMYTFLKKGLAVVLALVLTLFIYYMISHRKAMSLPRHNSELNEKAYIDFATGLPNKNKCEKMLSSHLPVSKRTACFMLDLNDLKKVNDTLGHKMGDIMILNFAKLLRKVVPLSYFVGRFGGDEFIVTAENISDREEAEKLVGKIKEMILKFNSLRGEFQINYACGYA